MDLSLLISKGKKMPRWNVLMTTTDYVEVEAENTRDAEMKAFQMYKDKEIMPMYPMFLCEEYDLIDDEE